MRVLQTSLAAWSSRLEVLTEDVKERIYNVLLFVDGGWMIDTRQVSTAGRTSVITCLKMDRYMKLISSSHIKRYQRENQIVCVIVCLQDSEQDDERSHQMAALRSLCLPRLTFLLLSVLQNSSRHQEALRLADIISSDQHRLYQVNFAPLQPTSLLFLFFCLLSALEAKQRER